MLFSFALAVAAPSYVMLTFAVFSTTCAKAYSVSDEVVSCCVIVFLAGAVFLNMFSSPALERFGMARTFKVCAVFIILGAWIRYFALAWAGNFHLLLIGQTLPAIAQPFLLNGVSKVATQWFGDNERNVATAIGGLADQVGNLLGLVLAPFFVGTYGEKHMSDAREDIEHYVFISAIIVTFMTVGLLLVYQDPEFFPSQAAEEQDKTEFNFSNEIKALKSNKNYIWLCLSFSMSYGYYTGLGAMINEIMQPYGYTSK